MRIILLVSVAVLCAGCAGKKKVLASLPAPSAGALTKPAPVLSLPTTIVPTQTAVEEPPVKAEQEQAAAPDTKDTEPAKKPVARRPVRPPVPPPAVTVPETAPPAATPAPAPETGPQLRELLSPQQRTEWERELSTNVAEARLALSKAASRRKLTPAQRENVSRIQTFLTQAQASRKDDLGTSLQLARRAALLGQELMKSLLP